MGRVGCGQKWFRFVATVWETHGCGLFERNIDSYIATKKVAKQKTRPKQRQRVIGDYSYSTLTKTISIIKTSTKNWVQFSHVKRK